MLSAASQAAIKLATAGPRFRGAQGGIGGTSDGGDKAGSRLALLVSSPSTWLRGRRRGEGLKRRLHLYRSLLCLYLYLMYICIYVYMLQDLSKDNKSTLKTDITVRM
jgi:hypothetical protein